MTDRDNKERRPTAPSADPVAKEFARRLREKLGERVEEIILFGSRARGDAREDSDYDVLVVVRDERLPLRERLKVGHLCRTLLARLNVPADVLVMTQAEKSERLARTYTVTHGAYQEGMPL